MAPGGGYLRPPFPQADGTARPMTATMKPIQMVDLVGQYEKIQEEVDRAILDVVRS